MACIDPDVRGDDVEQTIRFAHALGWDGVCIIVPDTEKLKAVREQPRHAGFDISAGIEVAVKTQGDISTARKLRKETELLAAYSAAAELSREILETPEIDVLRQDIALGFTPLLAKLAKQNNVAIEFSFAPLLHSHKRSRMHIFQRYLEAARLLKKFRAPFVLASGAQSPWDMRSPSDLLSFGRLLGFRDPELRHALSGSIIRENRKRLSGKWIMPGVERE